MRVATDVGSFDRANLPAEDYTWTSDAPVESQCILKTVGQRQIVEHAVVVEVDTEDRRATLAYLQKVGEGAVDEPHCWKLWRGYGDFELGWDDVLDRVESVREAGRGLGRRFYFRPMPPVLQTY